MTMDEDMAGALGSLVGSRTSPHLATGSNIFSGALGK
jgi:hypothetical protein